MLILNSNVLGDFLNQSLKPSPSQLGGSPAFLMLLKNRNFPAPSHDGCGGLSVDRPKWLSDN